MEEFSSIEELSRSPAADSGTLKRRRSDEKVLRQHSEETERRRTEARGLRAAALRVTGTEKGGVAKRGKRFRRFGGGAESEMRREENSRYAAGTDGFYGREGWIERILVASLISDGRLINI